MRWEVQKEKKAQLLSSWIENTSEEIRFAKTLYKIIKKSSSEDKFTRIAHEKLQEYQNPWTRNELNTIMDFVIS